jgi:hypothetical protein
VLLVEASVRGHLAAEHAGEHVAQHFGEAGAACGKEVGAVREAPLELRLDPPRDLDALALERCPNEERTRNVTERHGTPRNVTERHGTSRNATERE